jgi:hypothetical protein
MGVWGALDFWCPQVACQPFRGPGPGVFVHPQGHLLFSNSSLQLVLYIVNLCCIIFA